jgi:hypothetical protein
MEKKINKKVNDYQLEFKRKIKFWLEENNMIIINKEYQTSAGAVAFDKTSEFLKYLFDHTSIELSKEDFQKRERAINPVPYQDRCIAIRSNGVQCTRHKKNVNEFLCGTHMKGTSYGVVTTGTAGTGTAGTGTAGTGTAGTGTAGTGTAGTGTAGTSAGGTGTGTGTAGTGTAGTGTSTAGTETNKTFKVEIWVQEIKGINYYIDNVNNVYKTEDIISNKTVPSIIAKWKLNTNNKYTIPEFGI